jgi:hypothetical protein
MCHKHPKYGALLASPFSLSTHRATNKQQSLQQANQQASDPQKTQQNRGFQRSLQL